MSRRNHVGAQAATDRPCLDRDRLGVLPGAFDVRRHQASRGQEPAAQEATAPPDHRLAPLATVRPDHPHRRHGPDRRPGEPRPLPDPDPSKTKKSHKARLSGTKTEVPLGGNIGLPGEPSKFKTPQQEKEEEADEDEGNRKIKIHLLTNAEVSRLRGEAVEHQEH